MPTIQKTRRTKHKRNGSRYSDPETKHAISQKIYNGTRWRNLRKSYLMEHPLCEMCLSEGITTPACEVHHIRHINVGNDELEMMDIAYDSNNLMALCSSCHDKIHNKKPRTLYKDASTDTPQRYINKDRRKKVKNTY